MKHIYRILILLCIIGCNRRNTKNQNLEGNWSLLKNDSLYYEVKIDSNQMIYYSYNLGGFLPEKYFIIEGDSIFISFSNNRENKVPFSFKYSEDNKFSIRSKNNLMNFFKIDTSQFTFDKIQNFEKEELKYEVSFLNRKNKLLKIPYNYDLDSVSRIFDKMPIPETEQLK